MTSGKTIRFFGDSSASLTVSTETNQTIVFKNRYKTRRKSISGETFSPETSDNEEPLKYYPKTEKEAEYLKNACQNILVFKSLNPEEWDEIIKAAHSKEVQKNDIVIEEGDDGDQFYIIQNGIFDVFKENNGVRQKVSTYVNEGNFGELSLLYSQPRPFTVKAASDGKLWTLSRNEFRKIVLKKTNERRKLLENLISNVPILKSLKPPEKLSLADALKSNDFSAGVCILKQGDLADGMYFIESGEVCLTVFDEEDEEELEVSRLGVGHYFGELALLTHKPREYSAYAVTDVTAAFLDVDAFERLLGPCVEIMKRKAKDFENDLLKIFGAKRNLHEIRFFD